MCTIDSNTMRFLRPSCHWLTAPLAGLALLSAGNALAAPGILSAPDSSQNPVWMQLNSVATTPALPLAAHANRSSSERLGKGLQVRSQSMAIAPLSLDVSKFAFTAPGRAASSKSQTVERSFTFTPSRSSGDGLTVGMTARTVVPSAASASINPDLQPSGYNLDLSVGYRGFALSGGMSHVEGGIGGGEQEAVDLGFGYDARRWRAGLRASAERSVNNQLVQPGAIEPRYSVEARGMLDLSPGISLGGSLRYRAAPANPTPLDPNRDDRAVMLGGAVTF